MNTPIRDPIEFFKLFCKATGMRVCDLEQRACVITRSPANYGFEGSAMIEWEGSPPHCTIFCGCGLMVSGKQIKGARAVEAYNLIGRFLAAHPANKDGTPVWIGTRWRDKP